MAQAAPVFALIREVISLRVPEVESEFLSESIDDEHHKEWVARKFISPTIEKTYISLKENNKKKKYFQICIVFVINISFICTKTFFSEAK